MGQRSYFEFFLYAKDVNRFLAELATILVPADRSRLLDALPWQPRRPRSASPLEGQEPGVGIRGFGWPPFQLKFDFPTARPKMHYHWTGELEWYSPTQETQEGGLVLEAEIQVGFMWAVFILCFEGRHLYTLPHEYPEIGNAFIHVAQASQVVAVVEDDVLFFPRLEVAPRVSTDDDFAVLEDGLMMFSDVDAHCKAVLMSLGIDNNPIEADR